MSTLNLMSIWQSARTPADFQNLTMQAIQAGKLNPVSAHHSLLQLSKKLSSHSTDPAIQEQSHSLLIQLNNAGQINDITSLKEILEIVPRDIFEYVRDNKSKFSVFSTPAKAAEILHEILVDRKPTETTKHWDRRLEINSLLQVKQYDMAIERFKAWHALDGKTKETKAAFADILRAHGQHEKAIRLYLETGEKKELENAQELMSEHLSDSEELDLYFEFKLRDQVKKLIDAYSDSTPDLLEWGDHVSELLDITPEDEELLFALNYIEKLLAPHLAIEAENDRKEMSQRNINFIQEYSASNTLSLMSIDDFTRTAVLQSNDLVDMTRFADRLVQKGQYDMAIRIYVNVLAQTNDSFDIPSQKLFEALSLSREVSIDDDAFINNLVLLSQTFIDVSETHILFDYASMVMPSSPELMILSDMAENNIITGEYTKPTTQPNDIEPIKLPEIKLDPVATMRMSLEISTGYEKYISEIATPEEQFEYMTSAVTSSEEIQQDPLWLNTLGEMALKSESYDLAISYFASGALREGTNSTRNKGNLFKAIKLLKDECENDVIFVQTILEYYDQIAPNNAAQAFIILEAAYSVHPSIVIENHLKLPSEFPRNKAN